MSRVVQSPASAVRGPSTPAQSRVSDTMVFVDHAESKGEVKVSLPGNTLSSLTPIPATTAPSLAALSAFPGTALVRSSMKREMQFVIGASYQVATTTSGLGPNTVITNDLLAGLGDFTALASLFEEFFIKSFKVVYQPASRYQKAVTVSDNYVDFPLHVASLQHGQSNYSTHTDAASNAALLICNSADPWTYTWLNTENKRSGVLPDPSSSSVSPTQGWCLTRPDNASAYTGGAQIIAPSALLAVEASTVVGTVTVRWDLSFRSRK